MLEARQLECTRGDRLLFSDLSFRLGTRRVAARGRRQRQRQDQLAAHRVRLGCAERGGVAAGGAILAAELACQGEPTFAAVRPPGHHASPGSHWGFCFFNNVAIAIEKLIRRRKISHALILDIDLHFGDGTDNFFLDRRDVVVANIQENSRERFLEKVELAISSNEYDMIAISAGFDRHVEDWGGTLTTEDYFTIGRNVRDQAMARCDGKYFAVLEGGTIPGVLGENALALCRGMDPAEV